MANFRARAEAIKEMLATDVREAAVENNLRGQYKAYQDFLEIDYEDGA